MECVIRNYEDSDKQACADIFNHYVKNSFAAYPDQELPPAFLDYIASETGRLPFLCAVSQDSREVAGCGFLRPFHRFPAFAHTAEISYFFRPDCTGAGLGKILLERLIQEAGLQGVRVVLANISSLNPGSLKFHENNGFRRCGLFEKVGRKKGRIFDVVWMQRDL